MPNLPLAVLALLPLASVELAKAARWAVLFGPHRPPYMRALRALVAGQLTNALAPVRAGDAVRLGWIKAEGAAFVPAAASFAGAKAIDGVCLAAIAAGVLGSAAFARPSVGLLAAAGVVLLGVVLALLGPRARPLVARAPYADRLRLTALVDVANTLREQSVLGLVLGTTLVVWLGGLLANLGVLAATGIPPSLDLAARVLVAGYLVGLVPAPPARLGVFETGVTLALTSAGVGLQDAIVAAVTLHVCQLAELGLLFVGSVAARRWSWSA